MVNGEVIRKFGVVYLSVVILIFITTIAWSYYSDEQKLEDFEYTTAIVTKVGEIGPSTIVEYRYFAQGKCFSSSRNICNEVHRRVKNKDLLRISNLKVKYAVSAPSISKIDDERVKAL